MGLQLPDILSSSLVAAEADPNVETWMLFTDIILIYAALMLVRFGWLWSMRKLSPALPEEETDGVWLLDHPRAADLLCGRGARGDYPRRCALDSAVAAGRECFSRRAMS
ncbi:hypothetical protein LNP17_02370 [Klebsiella variicola subsp. variicola]|nr:hypothetical protein [Klebsiella variicola subsp. variicola]